VKASTVPYTTLTGPNSSTTNAAATTTSSSILSSLISVTTATTMITSSTGMSRNMSGHLGPVTDIPAGSLLAVPTSSATGGMKTGAKIGTVIGVIGGSAIIGFLFYFLIFLLKHRKQEKYNAQRVAQIQAKVGRTFSSDNSGNGSFGRQESRSLTTCFDISRSATPNLRAESERRPLPPLPPQYDTPQSYEPYRHPSRSLTHELRNLESLSIAQHAQLPSHYSFSGPPVTSPVSPTDMVAPPQRMTPVQEFAAAQLPLHFSFSGPAATSPIDGSNELPPSMASTHQVASPTSPTSPIEGFNEPPPRLTPAQQYAAAQLPSHFSFQGPPPPVTNPVSPIEDPTRGPAGIQEMAAAQLPSHYSFSGPRSDFVRPVDVPARKMTPAQELASARLRSNMSPMGLAGMDD
jgi:hypothetical protein